MPDVLFAPNTTRYSADNALAFAAASGLAYSDEAAIEARLRSWGFDRFRFLDRANTQAFVAGNGDMVMAVFRGTEPGVIKDWATDARIFPMPGPAGTIHGGFKRALSAVWDQAVGTIAEFQDRAQSVWFAGHSLGAALATLAAAYRHLEKDQTVNGVYTYGSPRVGDREFSRVYDLELGERTFRFVNNNDIVTRVPPRSYVFSHVGKTMYFDTQGLLRADPHWWNRFLDEITGTFEDLEKKRPGWLEDHEIARYVALLGKSAAVAD